MEKLNLKLKVTLCLFFFLLSTSLFSQDNLSETSERYLNERQPPDKVMPAINVKPGMIIGEIGAGRGRYTVYLARETGDSGKVFANDIDEASLAYLRGRCRRLSINNVETIVGEMNDPLFPDKSLDMAIMVLVYHMIDKPDELLRRLKEDLKPGASLVIIDPHDELIDQEFGIDRAKPGALNIRQRIENSAKNAGYDLVSVETFLPQDYIFILKAKSPAEKLSSADLIRNSLLKDGIGASLKVFSNIKGDTSKYELSEKVFANLGYEFIGSRSYPEALAVLNMGIELFPKSSRLYGEIGEIYLLTGEKENARTYYRLYLENGPDSLNTRTIMEQFDTMYEQMQQSD